MTDPTSPAAIAAALVMKPQSLEELARERAEMREALLRFGEVIAETLKAAKP